MVRRSVILLGILSVLALAAVTAETMKVRAADRYARAQSSFGNGTARAPVRETPTGEVVVLPNGTAFPCNGNCADALRKGPWISGKATIVADRVFARARHTVENGD